MQPRWVRLSLLLVSLASVWYASAATPAGAASRLACTITGTSGRDVLRGTPGNDVICGRQGDDIIFGGGGRDVLRGGRGHDILYGQDGADTLFAGPGPGDELHGERGNDYLDDAEDHRRGCRHPLVAGLGEAVPILLCHVIGDQPPGAPFPQLYVPARVFAAQMNELAHRGDHVITLQELYDHWHGAPLPSKPVVVSFDDGFRNQYTRADTEQGVELVSGSRNLVLRIHVTAATVFGAVMP